jgi:ABC-2 type transport system permease protein
MSIWADERKQGTDELLLTLPAHDVEIVLGKYLAALGIYTVAVLLSSSHLVVLVWLGSPDYGLMVANYLGYWIAGAALIPVGMLASLATGNTTIAFILAVALCAVPTAIGPAVAAFNERAAQRVAPLGIPYHFADFANGVVGLTPLLYFAALAAFFLYLNVVLVGRRHWPSDRRRFSGLAAHAALRAAAVLVALTSAGVLVARADARLDATAEKLHSLGPETRTLIAGLPPDRPVRIQAFVSRDVPQEYVQERTNLLNTLREIQSVAGPRVRIDVRDTEPYAEAARTARERFGIVPRLVTDPNSADQEPQRVFLGAAFTTGAEEEVIPFFEHGLSAEYEVVRAIRVVARSGRKRIGVIDTDARVFGGVDFRSNQTRPPWSIVGELRKQYEVVQISPAYPIEERVDALLVVLPSTMLQQEMDHVFAAIRGGVPALVVVDPMPAVDMRLAPSAPMAARMNPFARATDAVIVKNYGDIQPALASIGVTWPPARIAWDSYRSRPEMAQFPREVISIGPGNGAAQAFNAAHAATSGLQEVVMMYPGYLEPSGSDGIRFEPLVSTGPLAGTHSYFQLVQPTPQGPPLLNVNLPHEPEKKSFTLAAHIQGTAARQTGRAKAMSAIVIADLDFISDQIFQMRAGQASNAAADNITLFLNAIDVLAGDPSFTELRKRRVRHRTLERVERQTQTFIERRAREEQQANADAQGALGGAQENLKKMAEQIAARSDLDAQAKQIMVQNLEATENRKFDVLRANIEQVKNARIQTSRENMEAEVRRIRSAIRTTAVFVPPLPVFLLGLVIFVRRQRRERAGAAALRRLRDAS